MPKHTFEVGQVLVYKPADSRYPAKEVTVVSVGRRWVTLHPEGRFDRDTLLVDNGVGYAARGRIWLSWADLETESRRLELQSRLFQLATGLHRPEYSLEQLEKVISILEGKPSDSDP